MREVLPAASTWCVTLNDRPGGGESNAHKLATRFHSGYDSAFMIYDLPEVKGALKPLPLAALGTVIALMIAIEITIFGRYGQLRANTDKVSRSQETILATEDILTDNSAVT